jgi:hypothetical protein
MLNQPIELSQFASDGLDCSLTKARRMKFANAQIDSIGSQTQRALASYWDGLTKTRFFPSIFDFKPESHLHDAKQLVVWKVERDDSRRRFRALYQGGNVSEAFNYAWAGKTMDEVIPKFVAGFALDAADECALSGCVIYTVFSTWDTAGRRIDCERLLLPFGQDGITVEQIVASLQLKSLEGEVERTGILERFQQRAELTFSGKIRSAFASQKLGAALPKG